MDKYPNWFKVSAENNFIYFLSSSSGKKIQALQIGAYTGDASLWLLENLLTHPESRLFDIDTWKGSDETVHKKFNWKEIEDVYDQKILPYKDKVVKIKSDSFDYLINNRENSYDLIYIDGDHTPLSVFLDAALSWDMLKVGGIMIFDDYTWESDIDKNLNPKIAIDKFINLYKSDFDIICVNSQVILKKTGSQGLITY
jgi:predicted O-methyltransferase YrrM